MSDTENDTDGFERGMTEEEMVEQFAYDPFGKDAPKEENEAAETVTTAETTEAAESAPMGSGDGGVVSTDSTTATATPAAEAATPSPMGVAGPPQVEIELAALKSTIAELSRRLAEKDTPAGAAPVATPTAAPSAPADEIPPYEFAMPKALVEGLASEDSNERAGALSFLVKETSRVIHKTVVEQMRKEMEALAPNIMEGIETRGRQQANREAIRQDFFNTFPLLAKPELLPLVQSITAKVMADTGITEWNQTLRDAIGARAYSVLGAAMPQVRSGPPTIAAAPTAATRTVPAPPPVSFAGNARPAGAGRSGVTDEVYDTLFGQG